MNAKEAIDKIAELLGMKFKGEKFSITKLVDNETSVTNNSETPFTIGEDLYIVGEEGILKPAPGGTHTTREGLVLTVDEAGKIIKIEEKQPEESQPDATVQEAETEIEVETEVLSSATLTDGTKVETDEEGDFKVGQKLYVITEAGEKVGAPEGEHTTESGITLTVDSDSLITGVKYPDEPGEGSLESKKQEMKDLKEAMGRMLEMMQKFNTELDSIKTDYEEFKSLPIHKPLNPTLTFGKENILDAKVKFLREAFKK